jgi:hypothetical protein
MAFISVQNMSSQLIFILQDSRLLARLIFDKLNIKFLCIKIFTDAVGFILKHTSIIHMSYSPLTPPIK